MSTDKVCLARNEPCWELATEQRAHWDGILDRFGGHLSTGFLGGINSLIQAAEAKARGYPTTRNLITMAHLIAGRLSHQLPT